MRSQNGAGKAVTQEFHLSVTPVGRVSPIGAVTNRLDNLEGRETYFVRTELVAPGVPLAEEQVQWPIADWLDLTERLIGDPLFQTPLSSDSNDLLGLGQQLYDGLFQGTIAQSWTTAQGIAHNRGEALRLRLRLKDSQVVRLPWEILHAGDRPLTTNTEILFSRYHPAPRRRPLGKEVVTYPLKILMVLSAPSDQQGLALDREMNQLKAEFDRQEGSGLDIKLDILSSPDREQLTQTLEQRQYHIFHYSGHSQPSEFGGEIYLKNQENGLTEQLNGEDLAGLLVNNGISMALFNSCWSAGTGDTTLAESLLKRGIPSVLAMGDRIPDRVAIVFSQLFYRNLKREYAIDLSLNRTRQGLISAYGSKALYFALPILYLQPGFDQFCPPEPSKLPEYSPPQSPLLVSPLASKSESLAPGSGSDFDRMAVYQRRIQQNPEDFQAYHDLGWALHEQGEIEDAIAAYQVALATNPEYIAAHYHLGVALEDRGRSEEAIAAYRQVLDLDPEHPQANTALNQVLGKVDPLPDALPLGSEKSVDRETVASQRFPRIFVYLGGVVSAIAILSLAIIPGNFRVWTRWQPPAITLPLPSPTDLPSSENQNINHTQQAIAAFRQGNLNAGITHVEQLLDSGVIIYAIDALKAVPAEDRQDPQIHYLWGRVAWQAIQQGNPDYSIDDARRYWELAVRGDPNQPEYYNALGFAYYAEENFKQAEKNFAKAIALVEVDTSSEGLTAYAGTALVYAQEAKEEEAAQVYQYVIQADPSSFQFQTLGTHHWLWTNTAIAQWQFLLDNIPQVADK